MAPKLSAEDAIVLLLYANGSTGEKGEQVVGLTRLAKELFLLQAEGKVNFDLFFEPMYYGPYSREIPSLVSQLREGLFLTVSFLETQYQNAIEAYSLTPRGMIRGARLYSQLDSRTKDAFNQIKMKYNRQHLADLLDYVHSVYPQFRLTVE